MAPDQSHACFRFLDVLGTEVELKLETLSSIVDKGTLELISSPITA